MAVSKYRDISGHRFGILTAMKMSGKDSTNKTVWQCECDCGRTSYATMLNLTSGNTKSCGCLRLREAYNRGDIALQRFGMLTAISVSHSASGVIYWNCLCDCGNYAVAKASKLRRGAKKSCGCLIKNKLRWADSRSNIGYRTWAGAVKHLAECAKCGTTDNLHAHHIIGWHNDAQLRFDGSNGIALCSTCHPMFHGLNGVKNAGVNELCEFLGFGRHMTDALNYIVGYKHKGGRQDLQKAIHSIELLIEMNDREAKAKDQS